MASQQEYEEDHDRQIYEEGFHNSEAYQAYLQDAEEDRECNTISQSEAASALFAGISVASLKPIKCCRCNNKFSSRNQLFKHLKSCMEPYTDTLISQPIEADIPKFPKRISTAPPLEIGTGLGYRSFTYAIV